MSAEPPPSPTGSVTLRFLAAPTDVAFLGGQAVAGGRVLEWVDKAAYACAVGWMPEPLNSIAPTSTSVPSGSTTIWLPCT